MANRVVISSLQLATISELVEGFSADVRIGEIGNGAVRIVITEHEDPDAAVAHVILHNGDVRGS